MIEQLFAKVLAIPRITTYVDRDSIVGEHHDATWIVEVALDDKPYACILDGTTRAQAQHAYWLEALAFRLPAVPTIAVALPTPDGGPPSLDAWMTRWPDPAEITAGYATVEIAYVDDARDPDNLTRLCARDELGGAASLLLVTTPASPLVTPAAIAVLHERLPELRPIVISAEPIGDALRSALADAGGAHVLLTGRAIDPPRSEPTWNDVALAIESATDVELSIDGACGSRIELPRAQVLRDHDTIRVDAIATHLDAPVFSVELRCERRDIPLACTALHVARRATAAAPIERHATAAAESSRIVAPTCEPLGGIAARDLWVEGAIAFEVGSSIQRVRLLPAMRIATPTAEVELRVVRGKIYVEPIKGDLLCDGVRLVGEMVLLPYRTLVIDDVRASVALLAAWPDEPFEVVIESDVERYPTIMTIDDTAIELRRRTRHDELWCRGRPLKIEPADTSDLSWLLHAARQQAIVAPSGVQLAITATQKLTVDLATDLVRVDQ